MEFIPKKMINLHSHSVFLQFNCLLFRINILVQNPHYKQLSILSCLVLFRVIPV